MRINGLADECKTFRAREEPPPTPIPHQTRKTTERHNERPKH
jgi:hypothetical protein